MRFGRTCRALRLIGRRPSPVASGRERTRRLGRTCPCVILDRTTGKRRVVPMDKILVSQLVAVLISLVVGCGGSEKNNGPVSDTVPDAATRNSSATTGNGTCSSDRDCLPDEVCGVNNGACFGLSRATRVCWKASCHPGTSDVDCERLGGDCGTHCPCLTECDAIDPQSTCPTGEVCKKRLGGLFGDPGTDVCVDPRCPSNDRALCGEPTSLCGMTCICTADCSAATCANSGDGCGGECPSVCEDGQTGCKDSLNCGPGRMCLVGANGVSACLP